MTDAAVALSDDGTVQALPKHALSTISGRTVCGQGAASLPGLRWEHIPAADQCSECALFLSAEG